MNEKTPDWVKYPNRYTMGGRVYPDDAFDYDDDFDPIDYDADVIELSEWVRTMTDDEYNEYLHAHLNTNSVEQYPTGAIRDTAEGKPRYDLIDPLFLRRVAAHLQLGAEHYGEHNWTKGIPSSRYMASLLRHIEQYRNGERDEDHLAAAVFNLMGLARNEERRPDLHDLFDWNA